MAVAFQQQGSLDWVSLGTNSANLSVQFLQRVSTSGIDAYTVLVGQNVCGSLLCRSDGRQRFLNALKACNGLAGYRNLLWFGFGVKHVANALVATDQGTTCAALCACLAECYSTEFAAQILMEMTRQLAPPNESVPSLLQWHQLVKSCAGLVTNSTFGIYAEQMMRLAGEQRVAFHFPRRGQNAYVGDRGVAHTRDIAKTLLGLGKLSREHLLQMTIIGGADAGFIAAVADWLLDIRVEIRGWEDITTQCQETVFRSRNCGPGQEPQLLVIYEKDVSKDSIHCVGQTYRLPDAHQMIQREDGLAQNAILSGRVPWENALEYTFGRSFKRLMKLGNAFGSAIASAARLYQGLVEAESLPQEWLRDYWSYYPNSYGMNYLHFMLTRFPELEPLRDTMCSTVRDRTVADAILNFSTQMKSIAVECGCNFCCSTGDAALCWKEAFCLVYLAHAIIKTSWVLSGIITELCPMRAGLEAMFWNIFRPNTIPAIDPANVIGPVDKRWHTVEGTRVMLCVADTIFGGDRIAISRRSSEWTSAIAENGLCYFFDMLVAPSFGAGRAARVHVVPGRIEHMDRAYNVLNDIRIATPPRTMPISSKWDMEDIKRLMKGNNGRLETLIEERLDGLSIEYGVSKENELHYTFGPARAIHSMCRNEGLVITCQDECDAESSPEFQEIKSNLLKAICSDETFYYLKGDSEEILLVLGDTWTRLGATAYLWDPIIQRGECLFCCIKYGVSTGRKEVSVIMGSDYIERMKASDAAKNIEENPTFGA